MKFFFIILSMSFSASTSAGLFDRKEGIVFETKGEAVILKNSTFTTGIERRNIPIPQVVDIRAQPEFLGLRHDSESGWTKCRVPMKSELGLTGITERSLVFDCKPIHYIRR